MSAKVKLGVLGIAAIMMLAAPLSAQSYRCKVTETGEVTNWIAPEMVFSLGSDGAVQVNDGIIQYENGGPIAAKVSKNDDTRVIFTWALDMTNPNVQSTRMTYRANFDRATSKIRVYAKPSGYANDFEGRGTCKPD